MSTSGKTAIAIVTSALANREGFEESDDDAALRYMQDVRDLMAELDPRDSGMVLLKLGSICAALLDELVDANGEGTPEGLLRHVALLTTQEE